MSRRAFLGDLGRGTVALALLGSGACGPDRSDPSAAGGDAPSSSGPSVSGDPRAPGAPGSVPGGPGAGDPPAADLAYRRVELGSGFVSAFVLVRGAEVALVDTGIEPGDAKVIGRMVEAAGRSWDDVSHVILTHSHYDHVGSLREVLAAASRAAVYAGAADIPAIRSPREVVPVGDGDEVFGLEVIETPGHTPGHICVLDRGASVLLIGDALFNTNPLRPLDNVDDAEAEASVRKLAKLDYETILFGHGEPIERRGAATVQAVAERL